jgi:hypothetical protein
MDAVTVAVAAAGQRAIEAIAWIDSIADGRGAWCP